MAMRSAHSSAADPPAITDDIVGQFNLEVAPALVVFFCHHAIDGAAVSAALAEAYPGTEVIGCTSAGEFTEAGSGVGGTVALAFPRSVAPNVVSALVDFGGGPTPVGVVGAVASLERQLGCRLSDLDPFTFVGVVLIDGLRGREENVNIALANAAPMFSFVGGSAGDNLEFRATRVFCNGEGSDDGVVLAVIELGVPFEILKTCSFRASGRRFTVTKATTRTVYELDGRPVLEAYAEAAGVGVDSLASSVFTKHPLGVMIGGEPWVRGPRQVAPDGGLLFYGRVAEGMVVELMDPTDLVKDTRDAVAEASLQLGEAGLAGALLFNCVMRRLELDESGRHGQFLACFSGVPLAGFHTYGQSWLGHVNQTCTGILVGQ